MLWIIWEPLIGWPFRSYFNGTHGTGIARPAMPDMVRAIVLVLSNGETWQIETAQGITDPGIIWPPFRCQVRPGWWYFYSVVLSLGAMGLSLNISWSKHVYWLAETRKVPNRDMSSPAILDGSFERWVRKIELFHSGSIPHYTIDKKTGARVRLCSLAIQRLHTMINGYRMVRRETFFYFSPGELGLSMWILVQRLNANLSRIPESINMAIRGTKDKKFVSRSYRVLYQSGLSIRRRVSVQSLLLTSTLQI